MLRNPFYSTFDVSDKDMVKLREDLTKFFNDALNKNTTNDVKGNYDKWTPTYRVTDLKDSTSIEFDVPGVKKTDVKILANEYNLIVSCKRVIGDNTYIMNETFALSRQHDRDNITSTYVDGVLTVRVPLLDKQKQKFERVVPVL